MELAHIHSDWRDLERLKLSDRAVVGFAVDDIVMIGLQAMRLHEIVAGALLNVEDPRGWPDLGFGEG